MSSTSKDLTIIVPTLNEADNIAPLIKRIHHSMGQANIGYELLFIDDHSNDGTFKKIKSYAKRFPVSAKRKQGERGKAQSLLEGIAAANTPLVCMIDADLQYPPEAIPIMVNLLLKNNADVALSTRHEAETSFLRQLTSKTFNLLFTRLLFGIDYDTQSGLKVFKKSVFQNMQLNPTPWGFDLEFIVQSLLMQKKILTHDIKFGERQSGEAKVSVIKTSLELAKASIKLRTHVSRKRIKDSYDRNLVFSSKIIKA